MEHKFNFELEDKLDGCTFATEIRFWTRAGASKHRSIALCRVGFGLQLPHLVIAFGTGRDALHGR